VIGVGCLGICSGVVGLPGDPGGPGSGVTLLVNVLVIMLKANNPARTFLITAALHINNCTASPVGSILIIGLLPAYKYRFRSPNNPIGSHVM